MVISLCYTCEVFGYEGVTGYSREDWKNPPGSCMGVDR